MTGFYALEMEDILAGVDGHSFEIEHVMSSQSREKTLPFRGMDKSQAELCMEHLKGFCPRGFYCPWRHSRQDATIVCKHWLRHLCKKGDDCEFLHLYDMMRMPECHYYQKYGECHNKDCPFLHGDQDARTRDCPWYDRGFCKHGAMCRNRHTQRVMCINYLCGFCPDGPKCKFTHVKWDAYSEQQAKLTGKQEVGASLIAPVGTGGGLRPLDQVTCFKCKRRGHYANMCPQSYRMKLLLQQVQGQQEVMATS